MKVLLMLMTFIVFLMTALGLAVTAVALSYGSTIALLVVGGAGGIVADLCVASWAGRKDCPGWLAHAVALRPAQLWHSAMYGALVLSAFAGIAMAMGPVVGVLVMVVMVAIVHGRRTAPRLRAGAAPQLRPVIAAPEIDLMSAGSAATPVVEESPAVGDLAEWSDDALCWAWRNSYVRMQRDGRHRIAAIAVERLSYLDEFERRNPAGFNAWLAAGARAPSDPTRYLISPGHTSPATDVNQADPAGPADGPGPEGPSSLPKSGNDTGGAPS